MPRKADAGTDGKDCVGNSTGNGVAGGAGNPKEGLSIDVSLVREISRWAEVDH